MQLRAKLMLRIGKRNVKPGESFEAPKSQGLLMITNGFAIEIKSNEKPKPPAGMDDLTVKELLSICETKGIKTPNRATKEMLIALIEKK